MREGPNLFIVRVESNPDGALGVLRIDNRVFCWTLQPDPTDEHFFIPAGVYEYRRFHGTKHKDTFEIVVPGHTAILFHPLNKEDESEACIGLGDDIGFDERGSRQIYNSRRTFDAFMTRTKDVTHGKITFIDAWKG